MIVKDKKARMRENTLGKDMCIAQDDMQLYRDARASLFTTLERF